MFPPTKFDSLDNVYFTHIDKEASVVKGYRLRKDLVASLVWTVSLGKERFLGLETQFQTASQTDHLHFTPTAFSGENIIYKHIDSNVFALATSLPEDQLVVYLINGVSGKVLHRYLERNVRLDQAINMVLSEHIVVVAFQRQGQSLSQQEITVTELYSQRQEDNTKKLLMEYYTKGGERL